MKTSPQPVFLASVSLFAALTGYLAYALRTGRSVGPLCLGFLMVAVVLEQVRGKGIPEKAALAAGTVRWLSFIAAVGILVLAAQRG